VQISLPRPIVADERRSVNRDTSVGAAIKRSRGTSMARRADQISSLQASSRCCGLKSIVLNDDTFIGPRCVRRRLVEPRITRCQQ
jgi:hypothetical protein